MTRALRREGLRYPLNPKFYQMYFGEIRTIWLTLDPMGRGIWDLGYEMLVGDAILNPEPAFLQCEAQ